MTFQNKVDPTALIQFSDLVDILIQDPIRSRSWEFINQTIHLCSRHLHLMNPTTLKQHLDETILGDKLSVNAYNVGTISRFYNETVWFIFGRKREIRVQNWDAIVNTTIEFAEKYDDRATHGSKGPVMLASLFSEVSSSNKIGYAPKIAGTVMTNELLSYAHRDTLLKWIHRPNGIDDMLMSLFILAKIYSV